MAYVAMSCWAFGTFLWESVASLYLVGLFNFLSESYSKKSFPFGMEVMEYLLNHEGWWVGDWDGLKLESFPNCFL